MIRKTSPSVSLLQFVLLGWFHWSAPYFLLLRKVGKMAVKPCLRTDEIPNWIAHCKDEKKDLDRWVASQSAVRAAEWKWEISAMGLIQNVSSRFGLSEIKSSFLCWKQSVSFSGAQRSANGPMAASLNLITFEKICRVVEFRKRFFHRITALTWKSRTQHRWAWWGTSVVSIETNSGWGKILKK